MRKALLPLGMMVSLAGISACGPSPEPMAPSQTERAPREAAAPQQVAAAAPAAYDLAPVQEPLIVGMARWKSPLGTMSGLSGCSGVSPQLIEGNSKKLADLILRDALGGAIDTAELAAIVALDAPIDAVVALDTSGRKREPFMAISVGLTSLERAKGAIELRDRGAPLVEIAPGMWRVGDGDNTDARCAIAASTGGAPARLICAERDRDVMALGPYLARNAPNVTLSGGDLHGELRFRPLAERFGADLRQQLKGLPILLESQLHIGEPKFDRAVSEAGLGLQDELTALIGDLDKVSLDISVDPASCLKGSGSIDLKGKASWLAGTIADRPERGGPPPAIFWQVPKDSEVAFYGRGADPARFTAILQTLRSLAEGAMAKMNIGGGAADRKALASLLAMPFGKDTNSVQASGPINAPPGEASKTPGQQQMINSLMRDWLGWNLVGIDEGPAALTKALKDFVAAYNRQVTLAGAFDKAQRKEQDAQRDLLKRGKLLTIQDIEAREKKLPSRSLLTPVLDEADIEAAHLPTLKVVAAPAALGKGAMAIEVKVAGLPAPNGDMRPRDDGKAGKKEVINLVMHILLMVDDKTTWLAMGSEKDELVKRLLSVKSSAPATEKLSSRPSLEPLKNGKYMSGGFVTLVPTTRLVRAGVRYFMATMGGGSVPGEVQEVMRVINSLPHRGEAPIFFTTEATGGSAPRAAMSFTVSKAVLEDIGALVIGGLKVASRFNP